MKFLVHITVNLPPEMAGDERARLLARESARGQELIAQGALVAIWRSPGRLANVSIYDVPDADDLHSAIASLPLFPWLTVAVEPLATHPLGVPSVSMRGDEPAPKHETVE